jgi:hypothetical protein
MPPALEGLTRGAPSVGRDRPGAQALPVAGKSTFAQRAADRTAGLRRRRRVTARRARTASSQGRSATVLPGAADLLAAAQPTRVDRRLDGTGYRRTTAGIAVAIGTSKAATAAVVGVVREAGAATATASRSRSARGRTASITTPTRVGAAPNRAIARTRVSTVLTGHRATSVRRATAGARGSTTLLHAGGTRSAVTCATTVPGGSPAGADAAGARDSGPAAGTAASSAPTTSPRGTACPEGAPASRAPVANVIIASRFHDGATAGSGKHNRPRPRYPTPSRPFRHPLGRYSSFFTPRWRASYSQEALLWTRRLQRAPHCAPPSSSR